jgi:hypothetical protein
VRELELEVVAWVVGDLQLPPIPVTYVVQGTAYVVQTDPVPIQVVSFIGEGEAELRDIAPPVPVSRTSWTLLSALIGAAAALLVGLVALVVVRRWRRRRRRDLPGRRVSGAGAPAVAFDDQALARLDALERSGALEAADRRPFYFELSEIVRGYLGRRYGFPALDSTTAEIRSRLAAGEGRPVAEQVGEWLERCDLVKYASYSADRDDARAALADARSLIEATRLCVVAAKAVVAGAAPASVGAGPDTIPGPAVGPIGDGGSDTIRGAAVEPIGDAGPDTIRGAAIEAIGGAGPDTIRGAAIDTVPGSTTEAAGGDGTEAAEDEPRRGDEGGGGHA